MQIRSFSPKKASLKFFVKSSEIVSVIIIKAGAGLGQAEYIEGPIFVYGFSMAYDTHIKFIILNK
jgi:hypothetical protein